MALPKKRYIQNCTGSHAGCQEKNIKDKERKKLISRIVFYFLLSAFILVTGYVLFFSPYLRITNIVMVGNKELDSDELRSVVESRQQGKFLKTVPRDNYLLVSSKEIEGLLLNQFKKIKQVSVKRKFPDTLEVSLEERKALLILCSGEKCFLIDENGTAYSEADFNSAELTQNHLIKINDRSSGDIKIGDMAMNREYIRYVSVLDDELKKLGLSSNDPFWTPSLMADEVDVKIDSGEELYFSTRFSLETAIKTLEIILKKELSKVPQANIAYIDLRTENKVFYKLNNAQPIENADNKK